MEIKRLTEQDFVLAANRLGVEVAVVKAVQRVETGGRGGFLESGKPRILFERHIFWRVLEKLNLQPKLDLAKLSAGYEDILGNSWDAKYYKGGEKEYERLNRAFEWAEKAGASPEQVKSIRGAALEAISSGMFQILGTNHKACGYPDVWKYNEAMKQGEGEQLAAFIGFVISNKLVDFLKARDWAAFAKRYNGPGYQANHYDEKLEAAYKEFAG